MERFEKSRLIGFRNANASILHGDDDFAAVAPEFENHGWNKVSVPNGTHLSPGVVIFWPDKTLVLQVV